MSDSDKIRELNDKFRTTLEGGKVVVTRGIDALPRDIQMEIIKRVREFSTFTTDDDPYGEHDFGAVDVRINHGGTVRDEKVFWKIDYYDAAMEMGSDDPADAEKTTRLLTILLAEEY